jgi:DNA topoisomerase I
LIAKKIEKEANRYIKQWPEDKIAIENARWGPVVKFGKNMYKIGLNKENAKYSPEELSALELEDVKKIILEQNPKAFDTKGKKKAPAKKKSAIAAKGAPKKRAATKK